MLKQTFWLVRNLQRIIFSDRIWRLCPETKSISNRNYSDAQLWLKHVNAKFIGITLLLTKINLFIHCFSVKNVYNTQLIFWKMIFHFLNLVSREIRYFRQKRFQQNLSQNCLFSRPFNAIKSCTFVSHFLHFLQVAKSNLECNFNSVWELYNCVEHWK